MAFGSFSLCCYTCGKRVSVSLRPVYDIFQRVSGQIPVQIVHADMPDRVLHVRAAAEARACDMRREQHVLHVPQRTVRWKRFGLEHIECGAAKVAVLQSRHQIVRPCQTAASDIDQAPRLLSSRADAPRQQTCSLARVRKAANDDVRPREQSV